MDELQVFNLVTEILSSLEDSYQQFLDEEGWNDTALSRLAFTNTSLNLIEEERSSLPDEVYKLVVEKLLELRQQYRTSFVEDVMNYIKSGQEE